MKSRFTFYARFYYFIRTNHLRTWQGLERPKFLSKHNQLFLVYYSHNKQEIKNIFRLHNPISLEHWMIEFQCSLEFQCSYIQESVLFWWWNINRERILHLKSFSFFIIFIFCGQRFRAHNKNIFFYRHTIFLRCCRRCRAARLNYLHFNYCIIFYLYCFVLFICIVL